MCIAQQSTETLKELKQAQSSARRHQWYDNVAMVVLGTERLRTHSPGGDTAQQEVLDALEKKYEIVRDKLLLQVSGCCGIGNMCFGNTFRGRVR